MANWQYTYKTPKFFVFDVRIGLVIALSLFSINWFTITIDILALGFGWYAEHIGLGVMGTLRSIRCFFTGRHRYPVPYHMRREFADFGYTSQYQPKSEPINLKPISMDN
ncbi:IcmT/TraK family protein [Flexibacterium corallicola]|uniref:IcmT/TraK family protein n=1 Tax=Flexibacterium corallicola TaxID=3037259 RepID=UPI00286F74B7|nr:IcmT/TraK family protein [Pseudovibrio sp. M1P-2-3]